MIGKRPSFIKVFLFLVFGAISQTHGTTNDYAWVGDRGPDWSNNPSNWDLTAGVGNGEGYPDSGHDGGGNGIDRAIFSSVGPGNSTSVSLTSSIGEGPPMYGLKFTSSAPTYSLNFGDNIALSLGANAPGYMIDNQSGHDQTFNVLTGKIEFWGTGQVSSTNGGKLIFVTNQSIKGYLWFHENVSLTNAEITNTGGYTKAEAGITLNNVRITNNGDNAGHGGNLLLAGAQLTNVTITNSASNSAVGYTSISGAVTDNGGSTFTNTATSSTNRAYTQISGSLTGSTITNEGGYTLVSTGGSLASTVRNKIDANGIPGYLAIQGAGTTLTLNGSSPLGIDINRSTNGFVLLYNNITTPIAINNGVLKLYLDTSATYNNITRSLIYKNNGDTSSLSGEFPTVTWLDINGNPIDVIASFDHTLGALQTAPADLVAGITPQVIPLLQVTFSYVPRLSSATQSQVRSFAANDQEMVRQIGLATQQIARAVMAFGEKGDQRTSGAGPHVPFLSMTESGIQGRAEDSLKKFSPPRVGKTGIWVQPFGRMISQGDQGGITGYDSKMSGLMVGLDHKVNPEVVIGASFGYALSTSELNSNGGKTQIKNKFLMAFAKYNQESWYVEGILTANKNRFRASRTINPTTLATNTHDGFEIIPSIGFGYKTKWSELNLTPYFIATFLQDREKGYVETGAGANNLTVKSRTTSQLQGELGASLAKTHNHSFGQATYGTSLGLLVSTPLKKGPINGTISGVGFGVESNERTHTHGIVKLSSQLELEKNWYISAIFGGEFGTRYQAYEGALTLRKVI